MMDILRKLRHKFDNIDRGLDPIVDTYLLEEYYYIYQISGLYPYLRNGWWSLALVQFIFIFLTLAFNFYIILLPIPELLSVSIVIFSQNVHLAMWWILVLANLTYINWKRRDIAKFIEAIATSFFDYNEPFQGDVTRLKKEMMRERKLWMLVPLSVGFEAATVIVLAPTIDAYGSFNFNKISSLANIKMFYPFVRYPFSLENDLMYYFVYLNQICSCGIIVVIIGGGIFAYIFMSQHLTLEMKILQNSIRNIENRALMMVSSFYDIELNLPDNLLYGHPLFVTCYEECLKKNFEHHQIILRYFNYWRSIFSFLIFTSYFVGSVTIALSLVSTGSWSELPGTTISSITLCAAEVIVMYTLFYFSQQITDMNEELRFEMYNTKWYYCNASIRKSITIFQVMTLRPMLLKGCGIVPANMESFTNIVKGAYSYYNMVNAIHNKQLK